ncbi:MAG: biotin--[acetyl-CoA-carboxylase] ligase [Desulfobulbaceae bacterium A2]|nr:MAG: biotin--[acetyl-CoA-carboxylase] ligase [Desulfobulbaceae bacterium A2]
MIQASPVPHGYTLHRFPALASTNDECMRRAAAGAPHGTTVLAARQEAGRGRQGRCWHSPAGGLYLSVILRPELASQRQHYLPLAMGLALRQALATLSGLDIGLKWPNDILWQGAKLAGILVENVPARTCAGSGYAVVGLGVNLAGDAEALSRTTGRLVTSLAAITGREWQVMELVPPLLHQVEYWYRELAQGPEALLAGWRLHDVCPGLELQWHQDDGTVLRGVALGLDNSGAYRIRTVTGTEVQVLAGDLLPA